MTTLKQTLSQNSLGILEKMVSSNDARLKKKTREIPDNSTTYYIILREYEKARNELLDALYFYEVIGQEEIIQ